MANALVEPAAATTKRSRRCPRVLPELEKRKLPAWNIAQAKLGIAPALKSLGKEPQRVVALAQDVTRLEGSRHADQRAQAEAFLR